jgi:cytoskeletal protein CcmA (bactofilin family)
MTPTSRVAQDVEITGTIKFKGELLFEGKFNGDLIEGDNLFLGERAEVRAKTVRVNNFTSAGLIDGAVEVAERSFLKGTAHLQGGLKTFRLAMDDGATFAGGLVISKPANVAAGEKADKAGKAEKPESAGKPESAEKAGQALA